MKNAWIAIKAGITTVALQHCCGVNDQPVNCRLDSSGNWECPNCIATFGAATTIERGLSVEIIYAADEEE